LANFDDLRANRDNVDPENGNQRYAPAHGSARMPEIPGKRQA
jgi:hypothetical protein